MSILTAAPAICFLNRASGIAPTTTSAAVGYPAVNLASVALSSAWRSTAVTTQNVDVDLGATKTDIDVIALLGFNGEDDATVDPVASNNSNFSSPTYDPASEVAFSTTYSPLVAQGWVHGRHYIHLPGTSKSARYVRLAVADSGNPDGYLKAAVLWVGPLWQAPYMMVAEIDHQPSGPPGAQRDRPTVSLIARALTEQQSQELVSLWRAKLQTGRYLIIPRPLEPSTWVDQAIYATQVGGIKRVPMHGRPFGSSDPSNICWDVSVEFRAVED